MRLRLPLRIITLVCAVSLLAYACGDSTSPVEGKPVSLTLIPSEFTLNAVGDTKDLTATVYDALGNVIDTTVQFEPSDPAIVTVTAAGRVTATGVGVASVTASLGSLSDHFGPSFLGGERAIQKALVDNDLRGLESIEDVIGVPIETFLAEWAATLYLDDRGVPGLPARLDFPSWNLLDIYEGGGLSATARLDPIRIVFTNFARDVDVRAASTAYFVLAGDVRSPTAVRVRDQADGQLPPNMQVFLVRIF